MDAYQGPATGGSSASSSDASAFFFFVVRGGVEPRADVHVRVDTARARGSFASFDVAANDGKTETDVDRPGLVPVSVSIVSVSVCLCLDSLGLGDTRGTANTTPGEVLRLPEESPVERVELETRRRPRRAKTRALARAGIVGEDRGRRRGRVRGGEGEPGRAHARARGRVEEGGAPPQRRGAVGADDAAVLEFESRSLSRRGVARGEAETERGGGRGGVAEVFADTHRGGTRRRGTRAAVLGGSSYDACAAQERPSRLSRADSTLAVRAAGVAGALLWLQPMPGRRDVVASDTSGREDDRERGGPSPRGRRSADSGAAREREGWRAREGAAPTPGGRRSRGRWRDARARRCGLRGGLPTSGRGSRTRLGAKGGQTSARPRNRPRERHARLACHGGINGEIDRPTWVRPAFFLGRFEPRKIDGSRLVECAGWARQQARLARFKYRDCQTREGARHTRPRSHAVAMSALQGVSPVVVAIGAAAVGAGVTHAYHSGGGSRGPSRRRSSSVTLVDKTQRSRARRGADAVAERTEADVDARAWRSPRPPARRREDTSWTRTDAP